VDRSNLLERFVDALQRDRVPFCVIGGQAVNAYVEPVVSLDLDIVVATGRISDVEAVARQSFVVERFTHRLNVSDAQSDVRIQIQLDPRYAPFVDRATVRRVLDLDVPVAAIEDVLLGKIWAVQDSSRRSSKRQKDLADIARVIEAFPNLRETLPADVRQRLIP